MYQWPAVTIHIATYRRPAAIKECIAALRENISYPNLRWLISDDASGDDYIEFLNNQFPSIPIITYSPKQRADWGKQVNLGIKHAPSDIMFFVEDDYKLMAPLDLRPGVALILSEPSLGMLRYGGIAGHNLISALGETDISAIMPAYADRHATVYGRIQWWQLLPISPMLYIYSHMPHLKHRRFHDSHGMYHQGVALGESEELFAHRVKDNLLASSDAQQIGVLPDWVLNNFQPLAAASWQHTEWDSPEWDSLENAR